MYLGTLDRHLFARRLRYGITSADCTEEIAWEKSNTRIRATLPGKLADYRR